MVNELKSGKACGLSDVSLEMTACRWDIGTQVVVESLFGMDCESRINGL